MRFKFSLYEQGIFRVIIDDVITTPSSQVASSPSQKEPHKRFKASSYLGFEYQTLNALGFKVNEKNNTHMIIEAEDKAKINPFKNDQ